MSNFADFVGDFPARCRDLLHSMEVEAAAQGREVTFMLTVASAGFVVPFERLQQNHPTLDFQTHRMPGRSLLALRDRPFLGSPLAVGLGHTWRLGETASVRDRPDAWPGFFDAKPISTIEPADTILRTLRNALAHGNIWTTARDPIETIVFANRKHRDPAHGYRYAAVSPQALRDFLVAWFDFLAVKRIPIAAAAQALSAEAA